MTNSTVISVKNLSKQVILGKESQIEILRDVSLEAKRGEFLSIVGPSGSGKTSLLQCMSGLSLPTDGTIKLLNVDPYRLSPAKAANFRRTKIGFIFQSYNLIPALPAFDNVVLPLRLAGKKVDKTEINHLLDQLKFTTDSKNFVDTLSGGEQQKLAIARVLVANCEIVFADEPTGALDSVSRKIVFDLLKSLTERGVCVVMVTHDIELAALTDRALIMKDGQLVESLENPSADQLFQLVKEEEVV